MRLRQWGLLLSPNFWDCPFLLHRMYQSIFLTMESYWGFYCMKVSFFETSALYALTTQPKFLGLSLFIASNVSISALVARRKGQGKGEEANKIFATFLVFIVLAAAALSFLLVAFADPIISTSPAKAVKKDSKMAGHAISNVLSWYKIYNVMFRAGFR